MPPSKKTAKKKVAASGSKTAKQKVAAPSRKTAAGKSAPRKAARRPSPHKYPRVHVIAVPPPEDHSLTVGPDDLVIWRGNAPFTLAFKPAKGSPGKDKDGTRERLRYKSDASNEVRLHMQEPPIKRGYEYLIQAYDGSIVDPTVIIDPGQKAQVR